MQAAIDARMALQAALRTALERREFLLPYQPQVNQNEEVTGAEALLRWRSPNQGLVSPLHFIPMAEYTGLIVPIGKWVLDTPARSLRPGKTHQPPG